MLPPRTEHKFPLDHATAARIREAVARRLGADRHAGADNRYLIRSQYFDSEERGCYWEKQRRLQNRRKIRVRIYNGLNGNCPPAAFLEIKHKLFGVGSKRRLALPVESALRCASGDLSEVRALRKAAGRADRIVIDEVLGLVEQRGHRPAIAIRYVRTAYESPDGRLRITFDHDVACRPGPLSADNGGDNGFRPLFDPPATVLEVKSQGPVPYWLRDLVGKSGLTRRSFSKFCLAMENHDPVLHRQRRRSSRVISAHRDS